MPASHRTAEHHASAATQHEQAARYHREASRHFEVGKDFSHAAHQSIIAHGFTLQAAKCGEEARQFYAGKGSIPMMPKYPEAVLLAVEKALVSAGLPIIPVNASRHHKAAADHHMKAAWCHSDAARYCMEKEYAQAAGEAKLACDYAQKALARSKNASQRRIEYSKAPELAAAAE